MVFILFVTGATCTTYPGTEYIYKHLFNVLFRYIYLDEIHHLDDYWLVFITVFRDYKIIDYWSLFIKVSSQKILNS